MYNNIGKKLKLVAEASALVGTVVFLIIGLVIRLTAEDLWLIALAIIFGGALISWIMSFFLYGFGQLVENSDKIVKMMSNDEKNDK